MHLCFALAALAATWQTFSPTAAISLQTFAPCEDLSPHCPSLCASCEAAEKWPAGSHESFEFGSSSSSEEDRKPKRPSHNATKPGQARRPKRFANNPHGRGWFQVPAGEKPGWLPNWVPWWYRPRPHGGKGPHGGQGSGGQQGGQGGGQDGGHGGHGNHGGHGGHGGPPQGGHGDKPGQDQTGEKCSDLVYGSRQLIEAFCPKSCGRCGKSSNPLTAAKVYINAQCTVAKEPSVGYAMTS